MACVIHSPVPLFVVRPLLALAAIAALGLSPVHAAVRDYLEGGQPPSGSEISLPEELFSVVLDGDRAYVTRRSWWCFWECTPASRLTIRDFSPSGNQQILGYMDFGPGPEIRSFDVQGGFAYVACRGYFGVVDVSDPTAIHDVGSITGWPAGEPCVAVAGRHAYVGDQGGFHVVDVAEPASPAIVGSLALSDRVVSVALDGPLAYVGTLDARVAVVDVSDPVAPVEAASLVVPDTPWDIKVRGSHAYVADGESGLQILDVSRPAQPRLVGAVDTPGHARHLAVSGARAYVTDIVLDERVAGSLLVIDVSNPTRPAIVNSIAGVDSTIAGPARWWVHSVDKAVATNRDLVVVGWNLNHTYLGGDLVPDVWWWSSGYLTARPRVAYEAPPPRARNHASLAADVDVSVATMPATFALRGNSPNPFDARSSIRFELPRAARVRIAIYDPHGRLVKTLVDGVMSPGRHEATWQGNDENGKVAPAGIYLVDMEAESYRQTRKIALLR